MINRKPTGINLLINSNISRIKYRLAKYHNFKTKHEFCLYGSEHISDGYFSFYFFLNYLYGSEPGGIAGLAGWSFLNYLYGSELEAKPL